MTRLPTRLPIAIVIVSLVTCARGSRHDDDDGVDHGVQRCAIQVGTCQNACYERPLARIRFAATIDGRIACRTVRDTDDSKPVVIHNRTTGEFPFKWDVLCCEKELAALQRKEQEHERRNVERTNLMFFLMIGTVACSALTLLLALGALLCRPRKRKRQHHGGGRKDDKRQPDSEKSNTSVITLSETSVTSDVNRSDLLQATAPYNRSARGREHQLTEVKVAPSVGSTGAGVKKPHAAATRPGYDFTGAGGFHSAPFDFDATPAPPTRRFVTIEDAIMTSSASSRLPSYTERVIHHTEARHQTKINFATPSSRGKTPMAPPLPLPPIGAGTSAPRCVEGAYVPAPLPKSARQHKTSKIPEASVYNSLMTSPMSDGGAEPDADYNFLDRRHQPSSKALTERILAASGVEFADHYK